MKWIYCWKISWNILILWPRVRSVLREQKSFSSCQNSPTSLWVLSITKVNPNTGIMEPRPVRELPRSSVDGIMIEALWWPFDWLVIDFIVTLPSRDGRRAAAVSAHEIHRSDQERTAGLRGVRGRLPVPTRDPRTGGDEDHIHGHPSQQVGRCDCGPHAGYFPWWRRRRVMCPRLETWGRRAVQSYPVHFNRSRCLIIRQDHNCSVDGNSWRHGFNNKIALSL